MDKFPLLFEYAERILKCASIEDVWELHLEKMETYGFDRLLYGTTNFRTHGMWGDISDMLLISNHDREVIDTIAHWGVNKKAAVVPREKFDPGAHSWRGFQEREAAGELTEREKDLSALHAKWDISAGYTIWFSETSNRNRSVIGLCAHRGLTQDVVDSLWEEEGRDISLLNNLMHLKISQLPHIGQRNPLTTRQREVLQWVAEGKTIKDISQIMCLSLATVEKHLKLARNTLGVETTVHAVKKASILNQLFLIEGEKTAG
jgi:DNA-binding CsgD family transcriptional regulator